MKNTLNKSIFKVEYLEKKDKFGFLSMNILGDSISHGANAEKIYKDSWGALLKQKFLDDLQSLNYGFINLLSPIANEKGVYKEIVTFENNNCEVNESDKKIGFYEVVMGTKECSYIGKFMEEYSFNEIYIKVNTKEKLGKIKVDLLNKDNSTIETKTLEISTNREALVRFERERKEKVYIIKIENISGENTLSGIYLIENIEKPVLNNYSRSGARLYDLKEKIIENVFDTNILIFALGHNKCEEIDEYLNNCKKIMEKYKPKLIVLDFCWNEGNKKTSDCLKDFSRKCNGRYIDFTEYPKRKAFLSDKDHPTVEGHKMIFEKILEELEEELK